MPISDLNVLRRAISAANLSWRVREVPDGEVHGLGADEPLPAEGVAAAEVLGRTLLSEVRVGNPNVLATRDFRFDDLLHRIRFRPSRFDWRDRGVVGPVTNQGHCGSCVSFATAGLVAAQAAIELGSTGLDLSEADQHFNSSHGPHCGGWNNHDSLDQVRLRGISDESRFPYMSAFDSPPQLADPADPNSLWAAHSRTEVARATHTYKITNFTAHTGDDRKTYLSTVGPMICAFQVFEDFDAYGGGAYKHVSGKFRGGHAVLVTGYDDDLGVWICRNSWGDWWAGPQDPDGSGAGYFYLSYGECNVDAEPFYGCRGVIPPLLIDLRLRDVFRVDRPLLRLPDPGPVLVGGR
jgi:hypothetical protein